MHQISDFEVLPLKGKPISNWEDPSEGWQNVVDGIRAAINKMQVQAKPSSHITPEERETLVSLAFQRGNFLSMLEQMDQANSSILTLQSNLTRTMLQPIIIGVSLTKKQASLTRAIEDYNKAIENSTLNLPMPIAIVGMLIVTRVKFDSAIADCNKAIELNPELAEAYNNRGDAYGNKGELDSAIADCNKAIELNPGTCRSL